MVLAELTRKQKILLPFTDGITGFEGRKGSGKTTAAVSIAWNLRELFRIPVVCDFPLKSAFGEYKYIDIKRFVEDLRTVAEATKGESQSVAERAVNVLFQRNYPTIEGCVLILDEAYKYMESRTPHDKVVKLFGYWISQIRHYKTSLLFVVPHLDMVDKRIVRQMDRVGRCYTDERRAVVVCILDDIFLGRPLRVTVKAEKYWEMFDSWVLTPFRSDHLRIGDI